MAKLIENFNEVPETIRKAAELVCKRFCITGECDPMYICNVIAYASEKGTGGSYFGSYFDENPIISHEGWAKAANAIQSSYSSLITAEEIEELTSIMENQKLDVTLARTRAQEAHTRCSDELLRAKKENSFRVPYLENLILRIHAFIIEMLDEERKLAFREDFLQMLEGIGVDEFLKDSKWEWTEKNTCTCVAVPESQYKKHLLPLLEKHGYVEPNTDSWLLIEYWKDEDLFKYVIDTDYDCLGVSDEMQHEKLNEKVKELSFKEKGFIFDANSREEAYAKFLEFEKGFDPKFSHQNMTFEEFCKELDEGYGNSGCVQIARLFEDKSGKIWYDNEYAG